MSRDSWCTPKWLADKLGYFDLDPCSNERSHVNAAVRLDGSPGKDGLAWPIVRGDKVFVNPPYSRGQVSRWVDRYADHWDATFLLRWDPSTAWFRSLMRRVGFVFFPKDRIEFEPPPGVAASSNPFPHALYFTANWAYDKFASRLGPGLWIKHHNLLE